MLTYEEALKRILDEVPPAQPATVLLQQALGLVLAKPVIAPMDLPRFDNSAVDGYAIGLVASGEGHRAASPEPWSVIGTAEAGHPYSGVIQSGQAVRILTGAQVPRGADAVVMQEHVKRAGSRLLIKRHPVAGQHIRRRGEDLRAGSRVLAAGTRLRPQEIGLLAALGCAKVPVYPRPTVAILTTGDELQRAGADLGPGQIYESNGPLLHALVRQAGAHAAALGPARDALGPLTAGIRRGLARDLLVISGGVSVGEKDFVRTAAQRCGVQQIFWQVNIKPGMPLFVGRRGRTLVFGLPGNPLSAFVTFEEFVKPALSMLMGRPWEDAYAEPAVLVDDLKVSLTRRTHFIRVRCSAHHQLVAEPLNGQGSHQFQSLIEADGWIRMVAKSGGSFPAGTPVLVKRERHEMVSAV